MKEEKKCIVTSFQLSRNLHTQLGIMCVLTRKSMAEFIRISIADKIAQIKSKKTVGQDDTQL